MCSNVSVSFLSVKTFLFSLLYFMALLVNYLYFIVPIFGYTGFKEALSLKKLIFSLVLLLAFSLAIRKRGVTGFYHIALHIFLFVPSLSLYAGGEVHDAYIYVTAIACFVVVSVSSIFNIPSVKLPSMSPKLFFNFGLVVSLGAILGVVMINGVTSFNLNFLKVYEFRNVHAQNLPSFFNYFLPTVGKILLPVLLVISVVKRRYRSVFLCASLSILLYAYTSHKSLLLYPFVILGVYFFLGRNWLSMIFIAAIALNFFAAMDAYLFIEFGSPFGFISSFLSRRAIFLPVMLNNAYIDFFSQNHFLTWSESRLSLGMLESPYSKASPLLIGEDYFGFKNQSANSGFIGSGYANAGVIGVLVYSVLIGFLISYLESASRYIDGKFIISSTFILVLTLYMSADFMTSVLTHGLLAYLLVLATMPRIKLDKTY